MNSTGKLDSGSYESILKQTVKTKDSVFSIKKTYTAYIILVLFIALSFMVLNFFKKQVEVNKQNEFDKSISSVLTRIEEKNNVNVQILTSIKGVYGSLFQVVRDYFDLYASIPPRTYPSILSIMWAPKIRNSDLQSFIFNVQRTGLFTYKIHPGGSRDLYFPVEYIVPLNKNYENIGFDFGSNSEVLRAIEKARDSNFCVSTNNSIIRKPDTLGFYMFVPIYFKDSSFNSIENRRKNFFGTVILESYTNNFFKEALGASIPSDTSLIFQCFDNENIAANNAIYNSSNINLLSDNYDKLTKIRTVKLGDRDIYLKFSTVPGFGGSFQKILPYLAFGISLILSFAFFGFVLSVTTSRARAVDLAERMTRSQRRIVESSKDIIAVLDFNGIWKSMNPASIDIFGYSPDELIGNKIDGLFEKKTELMHFYESIKSVDSEVTSKLEMQMKTNSGELKWLSWNFTFSKPDELIYCIGRDITLEKLTEEQSIIKRKQIELAEQYTIEVSEHKSFFMNKLSHYLRNSLTSIIGYLQLITDNVYDSQDEFNSFIKTAHDSSEELFTYVSDIAEVASGSEEYENLDLSSIRVADLIRDSIKELNNNYQGIHNIKFDLSESPENSGVVGNYNLISKAVSELLEAFAKNTDIISVQININENPYEGATEIQILSDENLFVSEMISLYKPNSNNLVNILQFDKEDIILHLATAASCIRILNGSISIDTLGSDGNLAQITLPSSNKK